MRGVEREWLRRISGYTESQRRRRKSDPGGDPTQAPPLGEDPDGEATEAEDGDPTDEQLDEPVDGEGAEVPPEDLSLDVPDDVDARRKEEREREDRSALNQNLAPQAFSLEGKYLRGLAARFAR